MPPYYYKGYRIGSIEKEVLKKLLSVKNSELPRRGKLGPTFSDIIDTARQKAELPNAIKRLKEKGLVSYDGKDGYIKINLTQKGKNIAREYSLENRVIKKPKTWDGKWRIVIFDVPTHLRRRRDLFRQQLISFGFRMIQQSVWAYPFPCGELIALMKTNFCLGEEVLYLVAEKIEGEKRLERLFKLKK